MSAISYHTRVSSRPVQRVASWASVVFPVTMSLAVMHMLDDAFVDEPRGTSFGSNLATIAVPLVITIAAAAIDKQPVHVPTTSWSVPHRDVKLHTSDGLDLAAWGLLIRADWRRTRASTSNAWSGSSTAPCSTASATARASSPRV